MKVETYLFGPVDVSPEKVIEFPNGLVGFEQNKRFMLAHEDGNGQPTSYTLQSLDDPNLAFQIVDPVTLGFNYELNLSDAETALLQSPEPDDVLVMQVLFKQEEDGKARITPSLRAPLLINTKARVGLQKVMDTPQDKAIIYTLVLFLIMAVILGVAMTIVGIITAAMMMGAAAAAGAGAYALS